MQHTMDSSIFRSFPSNNWYCVTRDLLLIPIIGVPSVGKRALVTLMTWASNKDYKAIDIVSIAQWTVGVLQCSKIAS